MTTYPATERIDPRLLQPTHVLRAEQAIDADTFFSLRRSAVLDGCKWDPQVGDENTLAPFPLVMKSRVWNEIAAQAERLTEEALAAEAEILCEPKLMGALGLPPCLRSVLANRTPLTPTLGRVMRFDFHYTTEGWRISEVNSDVPGGFSEASHFTEMMRHHFPQFRISGNPGREWADVLAQAATPDATIALLSAPTYMEDHQVISFLAAGLRERGLRSHLAKPEQIAWHGGLARLDTSWYCGPVDAIVRFYQGEWLSRLPFRTGWEFFFRGGKTPVANPGLAIILESKRFPLVWEKLSTALPTWRALLPETRTPQDAPWHHDDGWLLKKKSASETYILFTPRAARWIERIPSIPKGTG